MLIGSDALFEFDKAILNKDAEETLKILGPMLKKKVGSHRVTVEGHTDAIGTDSYNQTLSEKRAKAVEDWLTTNGYLQESNTSVKGYGRLRPVAPNTTPGGADNPQG